MTDTAIHEALKNKSLHERELLADIIEHIAEVDRRKLFFQFSCRNLFEYLTRELKYSAGSARRRIDAARLLSEVPELKSDLQSGQLNLTQVSVVAQSFKSVRQKMGHSRQQIVEQKRSILATVKDKTIAETQVLTAKQLGIQPLAYEKKRLQADKSMRIEMTLTEEQVTLLEKAKELISHAKPGATVADVFEVALRELILRKDPAAVKRVVKRNSTSTVEVDTAEPTKPVAPNSKVSPASRKAIPAHIKRKIFQKDRCCQWSENGSAAICGSKFQLQIDHMKSVWAGGTNGTENLRLLCSHHKGSIFRKSIRHRSTATAAFL